MRIVRYSRQGDVGFGVMEDETVVAAIAPHPFGAFEYTGDRFPVELARLLAPVLPSKVVAVGRNYAEHAREMGGEVPADPVIFLKPSTSVIGPGDPIVRPGWAGRVDYEGELAVVVGRLVRRLDQGDAIQAVLGFACANDVTARDLQKSDGQWTRAKGFDTFCPLGPWIETDLDSSDLALRTLVNGESRPGDVLLTGTPAGVGPLEAGDRVEVEVEGIGVLANEVVDEDAAR
jgi:2-keto-4-pentenoate hydratase/2-oxohepta-3-ene-1,7-dioic acid hydratase in catechol pathway